MNPNYEIQFGEQFTAIFDNFEQYLEKNTKRLQKMVQEKDKEKEQQKKLLLLMKPSYDRARAVVGDCEEPTFEQVMKYFMDDYCNFEDTMRDIQMLFHRADMMVV